MIYFALMTLTIFTLSLGPYLIADGHLIHLPFNLPFMKISRLPALQNILPVRFSLYVMFFIAIIVSLGLDAYRKDFIAQKEKSSREHSRTRSLPTLVLLGRIGGAFVGLAAVVALVPRVPYPSLKPNIQSAQMPAALSRVPQGSVVLTYPYVTVKSDDAMVWQALSQMRFKLIGSYALVRGPKGAASFFPEKLRPSLVEAMLWNALTAIAYSPLPVKIPTAKSVIASTVVVSRAPTNSKGTVNFTTRGFVESVNRRTHTFVALSDPRTPVEVLVNSHTRFLTPSSSTPSLTRISVNDFVVAVKGKTGPGNVTSSAVADLQVFVSRNRISAIEVQLGRRDSPVIVAWMREAFGPPTDSGGGGDLWVHPTDHAFVAPR
jgi:hypothetical protein